MKFYNTSEYASIWTKDAINCYERGCNCNGCIMKKLITSQQCLMKQAVFELVRKFGAPPKNDTKEKYYTKEQKTIIKLLLENKTRAEIAEILNINYPNLLYKMGKLYDMARDDNFVFMSKRDYLEEYKEYIRRKVHREWLNER